MERIDFDDWKKLQLKVGRILEVQRVPKTDKLYRLQVDVGTEKPMQIVTGLVPYYSEEELQDQKIIVLVNLQPARFAGELSDPTLTRIGAFQTSRCQGNRVCGVSVVVRRVHCGATQVTVVPFS